MKTSLSVVKRNGQGIVIKWTMKWKVLSVRHNTGDTLDWPERIFLLTTKNIFPQIFDKNTNSFTFLDFVNLGKAFIFAVPNKQFLIPLKNSHFKPVVVLYCERYGATRTSFPVHCAFNNKPLTNSPHNWKSVFNTTIFKFSKSSL